MNHHELTQKIWDETPRWGYSKEEYDKIIGSYLGDKLKKVVKLKGVDCYLYVQIEEIFLGLTTEPEEVKWCEHVKIHHEDKDSSWGFLNHIGIDISGWIQCPICGTPRPEQSSKEIRELGKEFIENYKPEQEQKECQHQTIRHKKRCDKTSYDFCLDCKHIVCEYNESEQKKKEVPEKLYESEYDLSNISDADERIKRIILRKVNEILDYLASKEGE